MRPPARLVLALAVALALATGAGAQETPPTTSPPPEAPPPEPSLGFESPQATVRGYLVAARAGDWERAAQHLDLRSQPSGAGPRLARQLKLALDRSLWVDLGALDDSGDGLRDDGLPPRRDLVGRIYLGGTAVKIVVERVTQPDGSQEWKFSRPTVEQIPALYRALGDAWIAERLPAALVDVSVLDVRLWQWIGLVLVIGTVLAGAWALSHAIAWLVAPLVRRTSPRLERAFRDLVVGPLRLVLATLLLGPGVRALQLALPAERVALGVRTALLIVVATWVNLRVIDALARVAGERFAPHGPAAASVVPLGRRTAKGFVIAISILLVLGNFGFDVTGIVAGLGVGGIAVALGAQKSLENLFGGVSVIADAPVRVGDFCRFGDRTGTVVDIGLRSTRLRTVERTIVTVPNAQFSTMELENFGVRDAILLQARIALRYETTPGQLRWLLARMEGLLRGHPKILPEPMRVRFVALGFASLDVELFAYASTTDVEEFLLIRQELFLRLMDLVEEAGASFAFPPAPFPPPHLEEREARRRAVEEEVARWRAATAPAHDRR